MFIRPVIFISSVILVLALTAACQQPVEPSNRENTPTPASYFDGAITIELVVPSKVNQRDRLNDLDVVMTNKGQEPFTFWYAANLMQFSISDNQGREIWRLSGFFELWGAVKYILGPGESRVLSSLHNNLFPTQWDLRDLEGFPAIPGEYQMKGIVTLWLQDPDDDRSEEQLETSTYILTITEEPLPDYAQGIELELTAPSSAMSREPVSMDMRITNNGNESVVLWWSGDKIIPRPNDMDIVIFRDDTPVWRATSAHGIKYQGTLGLKPGESLTMAEMAFTAVNNTYKFTGEPWEWDQMADCGDRRFEPCDNPVEPGTYTVRGVVNVSPPETMEQEPPFTPERTTIATEPIQLVIVPRE